MSTQHCVSVGLFFEDKGGLTGLAIDDDGRVCDPLKPGDRLKLVAQVDPGCHDAHVFEIKIEGQLHRPATLPDRAKELGMLELGRTYVKEFGIGSGNNGLLQIDHKKSSMRILELISDGTFFLDEVGAFAQKGKIFLAHVPSFFGECFKDENGRLRAPAIGTWESMWEFMEELLGQEAVCNLPPISDYVSLPAATCDLPEGRARVVWFNPWKGFGYAETAQQSCRIHPNRCLTECQPIFPKSGQIIAYEAMIGGDKPELDKWYFVEQ